MPLGFVLIIAFSGGILLLAFLQALPAIFRRQASKEQAKRIKELEKELERELALHEQSSAGSGH